LQVREHDCDSPANTGDTGTHEDASKITMEKTDYLKTLGKGSSVRLHRSARR